MTSILKNKRDVRGGPERLEGLLHKFGVPEFERARTTRSKVEGAFFDFLDPNAGFDLLSRGADKVAADFLRPGGVATEAIRRARGQSVQSGFGTQGGDLSRQESNIISEGLRSSVGSFIGQAAPQLFEGARTSATNAFGLTQEQVMRMFETLYTGQAGAENLRLALEDL